MSDFKRKVALNTGVQILGRVLTTGLALFIVAALTRYLGVSGFGYYTTIFAFVGILAVVADFGFYWIGLREVSKNPIEERKRIFRNLLTFRTILAFLVFGLGALAAFYFPYPPLIKTGIAIICLATFFQTLNSTFIAIFQINYRMDKAVLTDILGRFVILALVLFLISQKAPLGWILGSYVIANAINLLASILLARPYFHFGFAFDFTLWKYFFKETLPMGIMLVIGVIYFRVDTLILSLMKSPAEVGIYGAPYKVVDILLTLPAMFLGNVFPAISKNITENKEHFHHVFQRSFDFLAVAGLGIIAGVFALALPIMTLIAGPNFSADYTISFFRWPANTGLILQILTFAVGLSYVTNLLESTIVAAGHQKKLIIPKLSFLIFNIGLNLLLIPKYSYLAAAGITVLTEILVIIVASIILKRLVVLKINWQVTLKSSLAAILMFLTIYFFPTKNLIISVPLGIVVYGLILMLFGVIPHSMRNLRFPLSALARARRDRSRE